MSCSPQILLSTGWMYEYGYETIEEQHPFFEVCDGAELSLTIHPSRFETYRGVELGCDLVTFHLSPAMPAYDDVEELFDAHTPIAAVIHPDETFSKDIATEYLNRGIPLALENLDYRLYGGMPLEEINGLLDEYDLPLVMDVQHAYEHDPSMEYARALFDQNSDRISHFHVSGESISPSGELNRHELVHRADNRKEILGFVEYVLERTNDPVFVIEGQYETPEDVVAEVDVLRQARPR